MTNDMINQAKTIFDDVFGRGHGKETTVTRFVSVFGISDTAAYELFDSISDGMYNE